MRHLLFLTALAASSALARPVYIGTGADGIYLAHFDSETGVLTEPALAANYEAPGFLALHPVKPVLLCVGGGDTVASFSIAKDHSLTLLGSALSGGNGPCHLAIDTSGRTLAVANYSGGSFATIRLDADGKPVEIISLVKMEGSGPNKQRQNAAHAHGVYFDKANRFLFVPDLGIDKVLIRKFDPASSVLSDKEPAEMLSPPGGGPRHMAFSPDEKHTYVINELTNTVSVAQFNAETGALKPIQEIGTVLPSPTPPPRLRCMRTETSSMARTAVTTPSSFTSVIQNPANSLSSSTRPAAARHPAISRSIPPANGSSAPTRTATRSPSSASTPPPACSAHRSPPSAPRNRSASFSRSCA